MRAERARRGPDEISIGLKFHPPSSDSDPECEYAVHADKCVPGGTKVSNKRAGLFFVTLNHNHNALCVKLSDRCGISVYRVQTAHQVGKSIAR